MKYLYFFVILLITIACGGGSETSSGDTSLLKETPNNVYAFKTIGLNDSIVADSIWKMIFTTEGIEQLVIQKDDSMVVISTSGNKITRNQLKLEITARGGVIID